MNIEYSFLVGFVDETGYNKVLSSQINALRCLETLFSLKLII